MMTVAEHYTMIELWQSCTNFLQFIGKSGWDHRRASNWAASLRRRGVPLRVFRKGHERQRDREISLAQVNQLKSLALLSYAKQTAAFQKFRTGQRDAITFGEASNFWQFKSNGANAAKAIQAINEILATDCRENQDANAEMRELANIHCWLVAKFSRQIVDLGKLQRPLRTPCAVKSIGEIP